ncbi:MAG: hypothetical protein IKN79_06710 [Eubacterium sp.]|nr:hypothetical protein [Eubacterium sp.]
MGDETKKMTEVVSETASVEDKDTVKEEKKKSKRISMYDVTPENDTTKFKGIFSYRHFRIAGWVCMAMALANIMIGLGMKLSSRVAEKYSGVHDVLSFFAELGVFLFLFANFAVIIDKKSSYKKLFIMYGALSAGFVLLFADVYYRFLGGIVGSINDEMGTTIDTSDLMSGGFQAFNIFLDMLLCTAVVFFIDYKPTKFFVGKKLYIFRAFAALPILYELACILLKYFATVDGLKLHPMVSPFLTTKPVLCFLLFVRMAFYVKGRETKFLNHGKTLEDYDAFMRTNRNSLQFARKFALMTLLYGFIDLVVVLILVILRLANAGLLQAFLDAGADNQETMQLLDYVLGEARAIGFGGAVSMIFIVPFIFFFSYSKRYKKSKVDTLIPVGAVAVIGLVVIEAGRKLLMLMPEKIAKLMGL